MPLLLLLLAQAAGQSCPPPPPPPKGENKAIFSYEDYPLEALRNHWEGTVVADLSISPQGVPVACRIVKSSGYKILDDSTCGLIFRRARFTPAQDEKCNPIAGTYRTPPITWKIP
jgi:periplasmic protein TonB